MSNSPSPAARTAAAGAVQDAARSEGKADRERQVNHGEERR